MTFRPRDRGDPNFQIAPLVDIMFILILFFTVSTTFATSAGIDINLPQSTSQRPLETADKIFVVIDQEGKTYLQGERLSDQELLARFREAAAKKNDTIIIIQADRATYHGRVVEVMDLAQQAGLARLAIAVEQRPVTEGGEESKESGKTPASPPSASPPKERSLPPTTPPSPEPPSSPSESPAPSSGATL